MHISKKGSKEFRVARLEVPRGFSCTKICSGSSGSYKRTPVSN